jgi:hypothetical protein
MLDEGSPEASSAIDLLGQASRLVAGLAKIDPTQTAMQNQMDDLVAALGEINRELCAVPGRY